MPVESVTSDEEEYLEFLKQTGVLVETDQVDEHGDKVYKFDVEAAEVFAPEFYKERMAEIDEDLMHLFQEELIDFELREPDMAIIWKIGPKGKAMAEELLGIQLGLDSP